MAEDTYEVVYRGKLIRDVSVAEASQRLAALFRIAPDRAQSLIESAKQVFKRGLSKADAERYREALKGAGLIVAAVREGGPVIIAADATERAIAPQSPGAAAATTAVEPEAEAEVEIPIVDDIRDAVLMPPGAILTTPVAIPKPLYLDRTDLSLADAGVQLETLPKPPPRAIPDVQFDLTDDAAPLPAPAKPQPFTIDLSHLTLVPIEEPEAESPSPLRAALNAES